MDRDPMASYEIFIGTWNTTGNVLAVADAPASSLMATDTYEWLPGRKFILHRADARFDRNVSRSTEIMGYDSLQKKYTSRSYDDRGVSEEFTLELDRKHWRIIGSSVRFNGQFDSPGDKLTGLWEMKTSRGRWEAWIEIELVRA